MDPAHVSVLPPLLLNCQKTSQPACGGPTALSLCRTVKMMKGLGVSQQLLTCWRLSQGSDCAVDAFIHDSFHLLLQGIRSPCHVPPSSPLFLCVTACDAHRGGHAGNS